MINMVSSPARPMDLDDDEYFSASSYSRQSSAEDHHTPLSKTITSSEQNYPQTPPLFRIVQNPFDPPTSAHLKQRLASPSIFRVLSGTDENDRTSTMTSVFDWSVEQISELHPRKFTDENLIQIDAALFDENLMQRYQRAAQEFCSSKLHLPTPAAPNNQQEKIFTNDVYGFYCSTSAINSMTSPFPHFEVKSASMFPRDVQCRPPGDFDSCVMEQCTEIANNSLDNSFNNTNQSLHSSRLSNGPGNTNVSFLKRRLFENEDDDNDVSLLPEDDEQYDDPVGTVTSTQRTKSPPRCDSETEDDHRISSPSHRLRKEETISPISSSFLFDVDCSPIRKD